MEFPEKIFVTMEAQQGNLPESCTGKLVHEDIDSAVYAGRTPAGETVFFRMEAGLNDVGMIGLPRKKPDLEADLAATPRD